VRYVLEGSVRRAGNRVRINAQMIDSATGGHVWADRYDRDLSDIFEVQDEVTRTIVEALKVALTPTEEVRRRERRKVDPAAYDLLIRGRDRLLRFTEDDVAAGQELLEQAVEIDPGLAAGFAWLSLTFGTQYLNRWSGADSDHLDRAIAFAEQACRTDPDEPQGYHALAIANLWRANYETAEVSARKAVELNPNFAGGYSALGQVLDLTGRHRQAIEAADRVLALDPYYDVGLQLRGRALFALGRDEEATISFRRRLDRIPNSDMSRLFLAAIAGLSGRVDEARGLWQQIMEIDPGFSLDRVRRNLRYTVPEPLERLEEGLRRALLL
jgi:adenylate cyclase